jgi:hypothetical protein
MAGEDGGGDGGDGSSDDDDDAYASQLVGVCAGWSHS